MIDSRPVLIHKHFAKPQEEQTCPFFLWLCLCLCRSSFHLLINYTCACACAYAYAYALVKTGLKKGLIRQANKTVSSMGNNKQTRPHDAGC